MFSKNHMKIYKTFFALVFPVMLQQIISMSLNVVDNFMVAGLGNESVAAVSFVNRFYFVFILFIYGVVSGTGVFISQYFGAKNFLMLKKIFGIGMISSVFMANMFFFLIIFYKNFLIGLFTSDKIVFDLAIDYLYIMSFTFNFSAMSFCITVSLRSIGVNRPALYITIFATVVNTILNYILIYGNFGFDAMGVKGAAIGTLVARIFEFFAFLAIIMQKKYNFKGNIKEYFGIPKEVLKKLINVSTPIFFAESFWVVGTFFLGVAYAKGGTIFAVGSAISDLLINIGVTVFLGVATSISVILGNNIGAKKIKYVMVMSKILMRVVFVMSFIVVIVCLVSIKPVLMLYKIDPVNLDLIVKSMYVTSFFMFVKMLNWAIIVGMMRSGGDTKVALLFDLLFLWLYAIPIAFFGVIYLKLELYEVMFLVYLEEVIKFGFAFYRYKTKKWIKILV
jgi:putative MATE family efflux protein